MANVTLQVGLKLLVKVLKVKVKQHQKLRKLRYNIVFIFHGLYIETCPEH